MPDVRSSALFVPEIKQLLSFKEYHELKMDLAEVNPIDLADGWTDFSPREQVVLFKLMSVPKAIDLFEELEAPEQMHLLNTLEIGALGPVLEELGPEETSSLFHKLPDRIIRRMMSLMRRGKTESAPLLFSFPENTAGHLMGPTNLPLHPQQTAQQALDQVRMSTKLHRMGELHALYVTDDHGRLMGVVSPRALIAAPRDMKLAEIMSPVQLIKVRADADQEEAAHVFSKYQLLAAPVVDEENHLLGILSVKDILHVINQEATEDMAKLAGTEAGELETGSIWRVVRLRMPWLLASWLGGIVASFVIHSFESTLSHVVALAAFMPVISGMGGNVGTQSSTIVVRGLATGHIQVNEIVITLWRELRIGVLLGLGYGVFLGGLVFWQYGGIHPLTFPMVVGLGICTSMTVAAVMGAVTPMVVQRFRIDPAICSAPFVSTATDILSLLSYFTLATWLLI